MNVIYEDEEGLQIQTCKDGCGYTTVFIINRYKQVLSEFHIPDESVEALLTELQEVEAK